MQERVWLERNILTKETNNFPLYCKPYLISMLDCVCANFLKSIFLQVITATANSKLTIQHGFSSDD